MTKKFLLDDLRNIEANITCRTAAAAYPILEKMTFDVYYFDHDLGQVKPGTSGYDVLKWAILNELIPIGAMIVLITMNPVGRDNMQNLMLFNGFSQVGPNYIRRK